MHAPISDVSRYIRSHIRTVPDWPAPGVQFRDLTPLLRNPCVFRVLIDQFVHRYFDEKPDAMAGGGTAIVDLPELGGSAKLKASGLPLFTLVDFEGH